MRKEQHEPRTYKRFTIERPLFEEATSRWKTKADAEQTLERPARQLN